MPARRREHHDQFRPSRYRAIAFLLGSVLAGIAPSAAAQVVPREYQGTWVATKSACESALHIVVGADRLTLANGKDNQVLGGIEMAGPAYFPPGYNGIMAVLFTEFSGHQPVILHFNADEKKGVAKAEFAAVIGGAPTPQAKAYNAHISKLNLARRFPLDKVALKKCG